MSGWRYTARRPDGGLERGELAASGREAALAALIARGLSPLGLRPRARGARLGYERAARLASELARLAAAGVALETALGLAAEAEAHPASRAALGHAAAALARGAGPAEAFGGLEDAPGRVLAAAIRAGERSGDLAGALRAVAPLLEAAAGFRGRIATLMLYPAAVALTSFGVLAVFFAAVVPALRPVLEEGDGSAGWLLAASAAAPVTLAILAALLAALLAAAQVPELRRRLAALRDRLLLTPAGFGLVAGIETALFARLFAALLASGAPAGEAMEEAGAALGNGVLRARLAAAAAAVREGVAPADALSAALGERSLVVRAARLGARSGGLSDMLAEAGGLLAARASARLERTAALAAPAMVIVLGVIVGALVMALFSALTALPGATL